MSDKAKALPFDTAAGYTGIPNVILTHYQYFPKLNGNAVLVYAFLLKFYNADYGYAFPTQEQAARALAISDSTYRNAVKTLVQAKLIQTVENGGGAKNLVYYFRKPIEDEAEFFRMFPEAAENRQKQEAIWSNIGAKRKARVV
ncbi:helix-turn-helix domain-containing protein [Bacillus siamensis]|uniref:helix-turn-helix domain-containing protein n=1 Tax=Bacillus TaxID=1386 RepID=UPI00228180CF|nr:MULTISPECIES: helix-turn-helix domain-containing protein [Bacillus]MED5047643.1 helix-turn-helix domain-containing protein [Bacillus siamensis]MED5097106.1 helix-turn-helix domain-containing protein [Bacillus siamensis]